MHIVFKLQCVVCFPYKLTSGSAVLRRDLSGPGLRGLEKVMAPHSSTLAWKIPWMEEPGRLQSMGSLRVRHTERLHFHFSLSCIGEGNGNPLQCSSLENPRDGGAWWAAVYGVAQSRTQLTRFSSSSSNALKTKLPNVFQRRVFKCTVKEGSLWVCDQLMHNSLIG